jgi:hypothetical protein
MAFSYKQLPLVVSFHDALEIFNNTKPIRGRVPEVRPLGIRRRHEASVDVIRDEHGEAEYVDLKLWGTRVMSFWRDEPHVAVIHAPDSNRYFVSTTTASFIEEVTGFGCLLRDHKLKFYVGGGSRIYRIFDGMKIERVWDNGTTHLNVLNPEPTHAYRVDRKTLREELEKYQPFLEYVTNMAKIMNTLELDISSEVCQRAVKTTLDIGTFDKHYLRELAQIAMTDRDKFNELVKTNSYRALTYKSAQKVWIDIKSFLESVNDACNVSDYEAMSDLYKVLAFHSCDGYRHAWRWGSSSPSKVPLQCVPLTMLARFRDLVKVVSAHKVFRKEELPEGKDIRDNNEKAVLFNTIFNT